MNPVSYGVAPEKPDTDISTVHNAPNNTWISYIGVLPIARSAPNFGLALVRSFEHSFYALGAHPVRG